MRRKRRFAILFSLLAAGLIVSLPLAVEPGDAVDLKATAAVSPCLADAMLDPNAPAGAEADAACDETAGTLQALAGLSELMDTELSAAASAAVLYEFTVDGDMETEGNMLDAMLAYAMSWRGSTAVANDGAYTVDLTLTVADITDPNSPLEVASVPVHGLASDSCTDPCDPNGVDEGSSQDMLALQVVRGHSYRVTASLATAASVGSSLDASTAVADYLNDVNAEPGGASVDVLALQVGLDLAELAAQVAANTEAIAANTEAINELTVAVGMLAEQVMELSQALEDLADTVANHTHTYLTGRGVGHNNTIAETSPPAGDEEPVEEFIDPRRTNRGRDKKFSR